MSWISSRKTKALLILFLLVCSASCMELYVAGNATGIGSHNLSIDAPAANVTGNNSSWLVLWEDSLWENLSNSPSI